MASINDIAAADSYVGNVGLGGGSFGVINLDTKPVDALAHYTFMRKQQEHTENEKKMQEQIAELAKLSQFDPNNSVPKDREEALAAYAQLKEAGRQFAEEDITGTDRPKKEWEFQAKIADLTKKITSANQRAIAYQLQRKTIAENTALNATQKDIQYKALEDAVNATDILTPIPAQEKFDMTVPVIPPAPMSTVEVGLIGGDDNTEVTYTTTTSKAIFAAADAYSLEMAHTVVDPNSDEWKRLTPTQRLYQQQMQAGSGKKFAAWQDVEKDYNEAVKNPKYRKPDGTIDYNAVKSSNPMLASTLSLVDKYNDWAKRKEAEAKSGVFQDRIGNQFKTSNPISAEDYYTIDKTKPLTASQLIGLQMWANAAPDKKDVDIKHTGEAGQKEIAAAAQAGENYRARLAASTKTSTSGNGTQTQSDAYSNNIIDDISSDQIVTTTGKRIVNGPENKPITVRNGQLIDEKGEPMKVESNFEAVMPADALGASIITEFNKKGASANAKQPSVAIVPDGQGNVIVRFDTDGRVSGIKTNGNGWADRNYMKHITEEQSIKVPTGKEKPTSLGVQNGGGKPAKSTNLRTGNIEGAKARADAALEKLLGKR